MRASATARVPIGATERVSESEIVGVRERKMVEVYPKRALPALSTIFN